MKAALGILGDENIVHICAEPLFCHINIQSIQNDDKTAPVGVVGFGYKDAALEEDKKEFGDGSSDSSTQAGLSAVRSWVQPKVYEYHPICQFALNVHSFI